ncbi:Flp family type IVb pilin [Hyphomonadaceae bacterium BL14]|nr:Flp family type IVb pilin [Hyphomonadaceae bacterium BL14]
MGAPGAAERLSALARGPAAGRRAARPAGGREGVLSDCAGTTAIEYALIAGLIALAVIVGISALGVGNGGMWANIEAEVSAALAGG